MVSLKRERYAHAQGSMHNEVIMWSVAKENSAPVSSLVKQKSIPRVAGESEGLGEQVAKL